MPGLLIVIFSEDSGPVNWCKHAAGPSGV